MINLTRIILSIILLSFVWKYSHWSVALLTNIPDRPKQ